MSETRNAIGRLLHASDRSEPAVSRRAAALAALSAEAVEDMGLDALLRAAAARAADGAGTGRAQILEYRAATEDFLLQAGFGWEDEVVGRALFTADAASPAGHVLREGKPLAIANLPDQPRFTPPALLRARGVVALLGVPIRSADGPYGVIEVAADRPRRFTPEDVAFLMTVANILGAAIRRRTVERALREQEDRLRFGLAANRMVAWDWDLATGISTRSDNAMEVFGLGTGAVAAFSRMIHPEDRPRVDAAIAAAVRGDALFDAEFRILTPDGRVLWLSEKARLQPGPDGRPTHLVGMCTDITERKQAEEALRASEERFRAALFASGTGTYRRDLRSHAVDRDENLRRLYGLPSDEAIGRTGDLFERVHPEDRAALAAAIERSEREGADFDIDYRIVRPDGAMRWISDKGRTFLDAQGRPLTMTGACVDITERKQAEEHQKLLMAELNHRVKNTLAVVQSIAAQTLRRATSPEGFVDSFSGRLRALAAAHGLLTRSNWRAASLERIVRQALKAHGTAKRGLDITGPELSLPPKQALGLSLVLHELATNAAKYGALSVPSGQVEVRWTLENTVGGRELRFDWTEHGGPPVTAPAEPGFGTRLIELTIRYDLEGRVDLAYAPDGLQCRIAIPWDA